MFDVIISGGLVVDGTETQSFTADVGLVDDKICDIGDLDGQESRLNIDATGLIVSPGFIDTHTHSEGDLLVNPQHANGIRQGITTEFLGIDGMSYAPLSKDNYRVYRHWLGGLLGDPPLDLDMSSVESFRSHYDRKVSVNTAYLVPHGAVRLEVLGFRDIPLRGADMNKAKSLVIEGIEQGAVGFSTGSSYYPGPWATTDELIELCGTVNEFGGIYMSEPRKANLDRAYKSDGVAEALEIARVSGVKLHIAHFRTEITTAGRPEDRTALVDIAKSEGVDCTLDIYPYPVGSSIPVSYIPSDVQDGGPDSIKIKLTDPVERKKIVSHFESEIDLDEIVFTYLAVRRDMEGLSLNDVARGRGESLAEALCTVLSENDLKVGYLGSPPDSLAIWDAISSDAMELLSRSDYMVCSDITPAGTFPHPRSYGAFPRFLGRLRRKFGGLSLEQTIHRMTDRPARRFGITKRGRIEKGWYADLVIFDSDRVIDTATYDDPCQFPIGIPYVIVNGQLAVDNEHCTGVLAGRAVP